jgi:6-phosphogluconolactonase/glucosamine-6-phosphate isomerase/deaminase
LRYPAYVRADFRNGRPAVVAAYNLLVTGAVKREAIARLLSGRITAEFPASLLQLHGDVQVLCDIAAIRNR